MWSAKWSGAPVFTLSEETAQPTVYFYLSELWAVLIRVPSGQRLQGLISTHFYPYTLWWTIRTNVQSSVYCFLPQLIPRLDKFRKNEWDWKTNAANSSWNSDFILLIRLESVPGSQNGHVGVSCYGSYQSGTTFLSNRAIHRKLTWQRKFYFQCYHLGECRDPNSYICKEKLFVVSGRNLTYKLNRLGV